MTTGSVSTALWGGVELLERAMGYTCGALELVTHLPADEAMSRRTPCSDWDLRALLRHMNASLRTLHEAITVRQLDIAAGDPGADYGDPEADPVATLRNRACQMMGAWANARQLEEIDIAGERLTSPIVAAAGAVEIAVHGWDVSWACGAPRPIPATLADELLDLCPLIVTDADRRSRFGPRVEVSPDADPSDRLLAFLGRTP
jgi:uncharacterized protein (TIGR03086 family)